MALHELAPEGGQRPVGQRAGSGVKVQHPGREPHTHCPASLSGGSWTYSWWHVPEALHTQVVLWLCHQSWAVLLSTLFGNACPAFCLANLPPGYSQLSPETPGAGL